MKTPVIAFLQHRTVKKSAFWLLFLALTVLSLLPVAFLPPPAFSIWDKAQHALGFAALTALALWAYPRHPLRVAFALLVYGGLIEVAQAASGWRQGDWLDLLADAVGIALVIGAHQFWLRARPARR